MRFMVAVLERVHVSNRLQRGTKLPEHIVRKAYYMEIGENGDAYEDRKYFVFSTTVKQHI